MLLTAGLLGAAAWGYFEWRKHQRMNEMQALARNLGLRFSGRGSNNQAFTQFGCFDRGDKRWGEGTLEGDIEAGEIPCLLRLGDFAYQERGDEHHSWLSSQNRQQHQKRTVRFSYALIRTPWQHMPWLRIRPENALDKVAGSIGFEDIDFESEEFSRAFHVSGQDKRFVYDVVNPRLMAALLREGRKWDIDCREGVFLIRGRGLWTVEKLLAAAVVLRRMVQTLPAHIVADLEKASPSVDAAASPIASPADAKTPGGSLDAEAARRERAAALAAEALDPGGTAGLGLWQNVLPDGVRRSPGGPGDSQGSP